MKAKVNRVTIELVVDNILLQPVDVIVTVTDPNLHVAPELASATGPSVQQQATAIGWCDVGSAVATGAGNLPEVKKIIHAVGPRWGEGSERGKLANATWASLNLAEALEMKSIALPAISVGTLGYPVEGCAQIMIERAIDFTFETLKHLRQVIFCLSNTAIYEVFLEEFNRQIEDLRSTGEGRVRA